jgi:ferredoxin/flavodoxin
MRIGVYYFSGTGNTEILAQLFREGFVGHETTLIAIDELRRKKTTPNPAEFDLVGLGCPVHAFNAPRNVLEFLADLPAVKGIPAFYFKSPAHAGDFGGASIYVRNLLERKGFRVFHESVIAMPGNFAVAWPEDKCRQAYAQARKTVAAAAAEILARKTSLQPNPLFLRLKTAVVSRLETIGARRFGAKLSATSACTRCETCIRRCPMENIQRVNGTLRFGKNCVMCMRCIYACPARAIVPGSMKFVVLKSGFDARKMFKELG